MTYDHKQYIGTVMGVSDDFLKNKMLDSTIQDGSFTVKLDSQMYAVIGNNVQGSLSVNINDAQTPLQIYAPNRNAMNEANPLNEFIVKDIPVSGIFAIQQDFDDIVVVPLKFARSLLAQPVEVSALEINYNKDTNLASVQKDIQAKTGSAYTVKNRIEQDTELYKTLNYERWFIFMILVFVLIIAIFNIIGSLTMLVIDKRKDIAILTSLGAGKRLIQGIFFLEGMMISVIGCTSGVILGLLFCLVQEHTGWIKMGSQGTIMDAYPVELRLTDFGLVFLTVGLIAVIASGISARLSIKGLDDIKQDL
jgi:lipoprotein-releasing system permease protein